MRWKVRDVGEAVRGSRLFMSLWRMRDSLGASAVGGYIWLEDRLEPKRLRLSVWFGVLVATTFGIGVARALQFPSDDLWKSGVGKALLIVSATTTAIASALILADYRSLVRSLAATDVLDRACRRLARFLVGELAVTNEQIGVHVWEIQGVWPVRHLTRIATSRPRRRPSTATWRKGKGAVGRCWKTGDDVLAEIGDLAGTEEDEFERLPPDRRFNLRWREFRRIRQYPTVLAVPLREGRTKRRRLGGVLSVDLRVPGRTADLEAVWLLNEDTVIDAILILCDDALAK